MFICQICFYVLIVFYILAAKKLPCNHIFHTSCLRSWFQRHQTCPTCRLDILRPTPIIQTSVPITPVSTSAPPTTTNINNQGPSTSDRPSVSAQTGNSNNETVVTFRNLIIRKPVGENNTNDTHNNNGIPQQNDENETFAAFMNATGLGAGIGLPTLLSK